jgi:hypothetical protein
MITFRNVCEGVRVVMYVLLRALIYFVHRFVQPDSKKKRVTNGGMCAIVHLHTCLPKKIVMRARCKYDTAGVY